MARLILDLPDMYYEKLEKEATRLGKAIDGLILEWILQLPETGKNLDYTQDPLYNFDGFESSAPRDLSINTDKYLYGEKTK